MPTLVQFSTVAELFDRVTTRMADEKRPMLRHKVDGAYADISYAEFRRKVFLFAHGLASLGIRKGDMVAIVAENRPEWIVADMAIVCLGAVSVPVYQIGRAHV